MPILGMGYSTPHRPHPTFPSSETAGFASGDANNNSNSLYCNSNKLQQSHICHSKKWKKEETTSTLHK